MKILIPIISIISLSLISCATYEKKEKNLGSVASDTENTSISVNKEICGDSLPDTFETSFDPLIPPIVAFKRNLFSKPNWVTLSDIEVTIGEPDKRAVIIIPAGFVTDLTSFPPIRDNEDFRNSAILHDYLYWLQPCKDVENQPRLGYKIANKLMKKTLKDHNVSKPTAWMINFAVKVFGFLSWYKNQDRMDEGETRFISNISSENINGIIQATTWNYYRLENNLVRTNNDKEITHIRGEICEVFIKWAPPCTNQ